MNKSLEIYRACLGKAKWDWHNRAIRHLILIGKAPNTFYLFIFFQVKQNFLPFQLFCFLFFNFLNVKAGLFQTLTLFGYMKFFIVVFILSSQIQRHCSTDWILTEEQLDVRVGPSAGVLSFSYFIISLVHFLHAAACHSSKPLDTINRNETKILNTAKFKKNLYKVIIRWSTFI